MIKIYKKINKRFVKFRKHPLTAKNPYGALIRYIRFNLVSSLYNKDRVYNWINGLKFYAQKGDAGIVPNIYFKLFDYEDSMFIISHLNSKDIFVDIGANVGHFTLLAAQSGAKVIAFEPIKTTFEKLKKNIILNSFEDKVVLYNLGVGDKNEFLNFVTHRDVMNGVAIDKELKGEKIEVVKLDEKLKGIEPSMLKIDVEGYEWFVLQGAQNLLMNNTLKYVLIELNNSGEKFKKTDSLIHDILVNYGFIPCKYNVEWNKLEAISSYRKDKFNTLYFRENV